MSSRKTKKRSETAVIPPMPAVDAPIAPDNFTSDPIALKNEILNWLFSILSALSVYIVIAIITVAVYHPDIKPLIEKANEMVVASSLARPKPVESLLFHLGIVTIVPLLLGFYFLFSKMKQVKPLTEKTFFLPFSLLCAAFVAVLIYLDFASANPPGGTGKRIPELPPGAADSTFNFFFYSYFIGSYLWLYTLVVVPLVACLFFIGFKKHHWDSKKEFTKTALISGYIFIGLVIFAIVDMNTFLFPYANSNKYDFNAVYYSMTQVYAGVPMLVNRFTNTYGLYPHFLNPLFQLIGLSVLKFSATMSILLGLAFVLNFYSIKKFTGNQVILFLGFTTMLFFSYLNRKLTTDFDCYFALFPIRYIIPSILLFFGGASLAKPTRKMYWAILTLMAFSVLWNPEIGTVCFLSWIAVSIYNDFYTAQGKINLNKFLFHILAGGGTLLAVFAIYEVSIYLFYGAWPELGLLWEPMSVFGNIGFMAAPMTLVNPWNLVVLIMTVGFLYPVVKLHNKNITPKSSFVLLLSLISLGYFFYFQCRSLNGTLLSSVGFAILLLTVLTDELWQLIKNKNIFILNALFALSLFLMSFSCIELVFNADSIYYIVEQDDDKETTKTEKEFVEVNTKFILDNSRKYEKINLMTLMKFEGLYFDRYKRVSAFNPGLMDMFLKSDLKKYEDVIRDSSFSIFFDAEHFNYPYMQYAIGEVAAMYEFRASSATMTLLEKRGYRVPADTFFNDTEALFMDRKYNDDTAGVRSRVNDASGTRRVATGPQFSVQVLFFSRPQSFPYAVVVSNSDQSSGFAICNLFNTATYVFGINGRGFNVGLPYNKWVYGAMNVFPDHVDVYANGDLVKTFPLKQPALPGNEKVTIGNMGNRHYFIGAIAEVAINLKTLNPDQVKRTWQKIEQVVGK